MKTNYNHNNTTATTFTSDNQNDWNHNRQRETSRVAHEFICIFSCTYTVRYQPAVQTRGHARAYLTPSSLLTISLSLLVRSLSLSPLGHRRSTIDASSLPASARIYGNVYAGRSYIRGFWRIAYIREILITWPTPSLLHHLSHPLNPYLAFSLSCTYTYALYLSACRASSSKGNTVPW